MLLEYAAFFLFESRLSVKNPSSLSITKIEDKKRKRETLILNMLDIKAQLPIKKHLNFFENLESENLSVL